MTDIAWVTLGLVVVTGIYGVLVFIQINQFRKFTLKQIRGQVETDTTQIRLKRAEFLHEADQKTKDGKSPMDILNERECQCKKTVKRIEAELQSSILKKLIVKVQKRGKRNG